MSTVYGLYAMFDDRIGMMQDAERAAQSRMDAVSSVLYILRITEAPLRQFGSISVAVWGANIGRGLPSI